MKRLLKIIKQTESCDCRFISESIPENLFAANTFKDYLEKEYSVTHPIAESKVEILNEKDTSEEEGKGQFSSSISLMEEIKRKRLIKEYLKVFFKENQGMIKCKYFLKESIYT